MTLTKDATIVPVEKSTQVPFSNRHPKSNALQSNYTPKDNLHPSDYNFPQPSRKPAETSPLSHSDLEIDRISDHSFEFEPLHDPNSPISSIDTTTEADDIKSYYYTDESPPTKAESKDLSKFFQKRK
jgi:hypothetical protein